MTLFVAQYLAIVADARSVSFVYVSFKYIVILRLNYSETTWTGALGKTLSNHNLFQKTKDFQVFLQTDR